jgi:hypothetical protein
MSDLSNDTKKHTTKSRETIPLMLSRHLNRGVHFQMSCRIFTFFHMKTNLKVKIYMTRQYLCNTSIKQTPRRPPQKALEDIL